MESKLPAASAWTNVTALGMFVAPVLLFASTIVYSLGGGYNADHTGGIIQLYAFAAFIPVILGLSRLVEVSSPRNAAVLMVLGPLGLAGGIAYAIDSVYFAATGVSAEELGAAGPLALQLPGLCFPLSLLLAGLTLVRTGVGPRWSGIILMLAALLFPMSRIGSIEALGIAADSLFVAALWPLGWAILQGRGVSYASAARRTLPGEV